jgi:xanthine dehydrogenase YagR molybdenum-binding subunit
MNAVIERAPPRLEAALKVTGAARYPGETPVRELLHAALVVAPLPHGRVVRIEAAKARAMPGVFEILTHENADRLPPTEYLMLLQEPLVQFAGQPVALVVGETAAIARRAAAAVDVTYEPLPAVTSIEQGLADAFAPKTAGRRPTDSRRGDPERAFREAEAVIDRRYTTPVHNHNPMELNAVIAAWQGDSVTVHSTTQAVFGTRRIVAHCFGLPIDKVRVIAKHVGGGFGGKTYGWFPCAMLCVMAARRAGRPVKLELTRAQMFTLVGRRQDSIQHVRLGATRDGRLTAIVHDTVAQTSPFGEYADANGSAARFLYACPNVATAHRLVRVNAPQPKPMRGPGEGTGTFALESAMDELAEALGLDPLELRLRNYADHDQQENLPWSSNGVRECYRVGAEAFGWDKRPRGIGTWRDGHHRIGWGMASSCFPVFRMASQASITIGSDARVLVRCGTQDIGTGSYTVLAQLAAETLGVPLDRVAVELGDTLLPEGPYSGAHLATASFTPAVEEASRTLRRRLLERAVADPLSPLHGAPVDQLTIDDGLLRSTVGNRSESIADLMTRTGEAIEATASTAPEETLNYSANGYGAVFAEVRVDPELGEVRVSRLTGAYAAGRVVNPLLARSQHIGGLVWGIGLALHEATVMDRRLGRIINDNLSDYLLPVHADMPRFDVHLVPEEDPHLASGIKGIGMLSIVGVAAAIANAVYHATGQRIRELPIRPEHFIGTQKRGDYSARSSAS